MKLQDFHVEVADGANADQQTVLRMLRADALLELGLDADTLDEAHDAAPWQVLARDDAGHVLGAAGLHAGRTIAWFVVSAAWCGRGVGSALLHALLAHARSQGADAVSATVPVAASGFFARAGFTPDGPPHTGGQTAWQTLRLPLAADVRESSAARPSGRAPLPAHSRSLVAAARRQLLADARHQLMVYVPTLDADWFAGVEELDELRRVACSGRTASIRIVLHDPAAAMANDHPLLPLMQRLSSAFAVRTPVEEADLAYVGAYLLNDVGGYLHLPVAVRAAGSAARHHRAAQLPLRQHHAAVWERSLPATVLDALDL